MNREEDALQIAAIDFLRMAAPDLIVWFVPNGGNLSKAQAGRFKAMGLRKGVSDLHMLLPSGQLGVIELKSRKGQLSIEQDQFIEDVFRGGGRSAVARSVEDVERTVRAWGVPLRTTILPSGVIKRDV